MSIGIKPFCELNAFHMFRCVSLRSVIKGESAFSDWSLVRELMTAITTTAVSLLCMFFDILFRVMKIMTLQKMYDAPNLSDHANVIISFFYDYLL